MVTFLQRAEGVGFVAAAAEDEAGEGAGQGVGGGAGRAEVEGAVDAAALEEELSAVAEAVVEGDLGDDGVDADLEGEDIDLVEHGLDGVVLGGGGVEQDGVVFSVGNDADGVQVGVAGPAPGAPGAAALGTTGRVETAEERIGRILAGGGGRSVLGLRRRGRWSRSTGPSRCCADRRRRWNRRHC